MLIYKLTNTINNKIYIGKTIRTLEERLSNHKKDALAYTRGTYHHNSPIVFAIAVHGLDAFTSEIIDTAETEDELNKKEKHWIRVLKARNRTIGYNIHPGGKGGGHKHTQATKKHLSKIKKRAGAWKGTKNPKAKLTGARKAKLIAAFRAGSSTRQLATKYKINISQVGRILKENGIKLAKANSKITQRIAEQIRAEYTSIRGAIVALAKKYNLTSESIQNILRHRTWNS